MNDEEPKLGQVLVPEFFIVAFRPKGNAKGFFICGGGPGAEFDSGNGIKVTPQIGTKRDVAEVQFKLSSEHGKDIADGDILLIRLTNGTIIKQSPCHGKDQTEITE